MKAFVPVLVVVLAVGALTACGSGSAAPAPMVPAAVAPAGSDTTSDPTSDGAAGDGAGAAVVDICALMPAKNVAMMAGMALDVATPDVTNGPGEHQCLYSTTEGGNAMSITVNATSGVQAYEEDLASVSSAAKKVDGVGDKAFSSVLGLHVLTGTTLIEVSGVDDVAAASELAKTLAYQL